MSRKNIFLWIQSVLCVVICLLFIVSAIAVYREGMALRMAGDHIAWIYTRDKVLTTLRPAFLLIPVSMFITAAGSFLDHKDSTEGKACDAGKFSAGAGKKYSRKRVGLDKTRQNHVSAEVTRRVNVIRICLLAISILLIIHGVMNGSMGDVFHKAINICTECIGLG